MSLRDELQEIQSKKISQQDLQKLKDKYMYKYISLHVSTVYNNIIKNEILKHAKQKTGFLSGISSFPGIKCISHVDCQGIRKPHELKHANVSDGFVFLFEKDSHFFVKYNCKVQEQWEKDYKKLCEEWKEETKDISNVEGDFDSDMIWFDKYDSVRTNLPRTFGDVIRKKHPYKVSFQLGDKILYFKKELIKIAKQDEVIIDEIYLSDFYYTFSILHEEKTDRNEGFTAVSVKWHINL